MKLTKKISVIAMTLLLSSVMMAQNDDPKTRVGFGGFSVVNTSLAGEWTLELGGIGGGFITESIYVGGGGFGMEQTKNDIEYKLEYGGLMVGYLWGEIDRSALNFNILGCYGGIKEISEDSRYIEDDVWIVKPSIEADFYIMPKLRIGIGGGYRWVMGNSISSIGNSDLSAPFGSITLRIGNWIN